MEEFQTNAKIMVYAPQLYPYYQNQQMTPPTWFDQLESFYERYKDLFNLVVPTILLVAIGKLNSWRAEIKERERLKTVAQQADSKSLVDLNTTVKALAENIEAQTSHFNDQFVTLRREMKKNQDNTEVALTDIRKEAKSDIKDVHDRIDKIILKPRT